MSRINLLGIIILMFVFSVGCATTNLETYQAKSAEEKEVLDFFVECDEAFQNKDMTKYSDCFHEDATIMVFDSPGTIVTVSKQNFTQNYLMKGRGAFQGQKITNPEITATKNTAKVSYTEDNSGLSTTFNVRCDLIKENGKWYITRSNW